MAVYEGARQRPAFLPRRAVEEEQAPALPRRRIRRARGAVRVGGRGTRVGAILAAILVAFVLAFFTLTQSVRVAATSYDIDRLGVERDRIENRILDLRSDLNRLGKAPAIRKLGLDGGLDQLAEPLVIPAH
jgi:hypothetical protein